MLIPDRYVIFDLETTGLSPQYAEIIEIGAVRVVNGIITERFQTYVKPLGRIPRASPRHKPQMPLASNRRITNSLPLSKTTCLLRTTARLTAVL